MKNIITLHNGYVEILVISKEYKRIVLVDLDDLEKIGKIKISNRGYVYQAKQNGTSITNIIMNFKTSNKMYIDHINGNTLDNRKSNLRIVTPSENARNRRTFTRNNTGVVGIQYRKNKNYEYYRVSITNLNLKRETKQFNINKVGKEKAFNLAKEYLLKKKKENNYI